MKEVSRSFYLTLRFLPSSVRELISLGYLLARASDTIADTETVPVQKRIQALDQFTSCFRLRECTGELALHLEEFAHELDHEGEVVLMKTMPEIFLELGHLQDEEWRALQAVVMQICETQRWDLTRFPEGEVTRLNTDEELNQYTYGVAGCVGEFWTEVIVINGLIPSHRADELRSLGARYGRGLQLVNILRDFYEDWEKGRCYIPGSEVDQDEAYSHLAEWILETESSIADGFKYCRLLRFGRLKFATILPAILARKTLQKLKKSSPDELRNRVKISRRAVNVALIEALWRSTFSK